jgi:hypothetical protein
MPADLRVLPGGAPTRPPQVGGENLRTTWIQDGLVYVMTESPDGYRVTDIMTPGEARDWADELLDLAREAEAKR